MRRTFLLHYNYRMPALYLCLLVQTLTTLVLWLSCLPIAGQVHAASPITSSGLNTQVNLSQTPPLGKVQYDITGGTRTGTNLFHSFGQFNVPTNNIANFLNDSGLATTNILGRVTGGNLSAIYGTIQTTGFGGANLFLMNPAGFLFGPNATVNVGGMVTFTSADYLRLADGVRFNAIPNAASDALLSAAPVAAFGFLGSTPGAITVQGSRFVVTEGTGISLVGGNITIQSGALDDGTVQSAKLSAPGGQINLVSAASAGEVSAIDFMPTPGMTMGSISLSQGALLDVSANGAGMVRIRGGQLMIDQATISADTANADGAAVAIDINVTGDISLANELNPALTARTTGIGNAGTINITSGNLNAITSSSDPLVALIDTHTSGTGTAGSVTITTGDLHATNGAFFIDTGTAGTGHGGDIDIQGTNILIENAFIATGNLRFGQFLGQDVSGSGGNLSMKATKSLDLNGAGLSTEAFFAVAGNIALEAPDIFIHQGSQVALDGDFGGATMRVNADRLRLDLGSVLSNNTVVDPGGETTINARVVELTNGSRIQTSTFGDGNAGNIKLTATERLTIDDRANGINLVSGLISSVTEGGVGNFGGSGSITVTTPRLEMFGGGIINTTTRSSGNAGGISIFANSVTISGQRRTELAGSDLELGSTRGTGIYSRTVVGDLCSGLCGNGGKITIMTDSLNLDSGGTINSGTSTNGAGGNITINATNSISISGATTDGTPSGIYSRTVGQTADAGIGGNITLTAGQAVTMNNGSTISASSTGSGNAGNISIDAGQQLAMLNSTITTQAAQAGGGNINLRAVDIVSLGNSTVSTSVLGGSGSGGNITIDPNIVLLQNSQILAQAVLGAGGNISILTNLLLADATSTISASSQFGTNGIVTVQSPLSPASGKIIPLSQKPLLANALLNQRCAALAGGSFSSFTVSGRDSLPAEPGSWLSSPLALGILESDSGTLTRAGSNVTVLESAEETPLVSLRQIAPPGFLTQTFAVDSSAGCTS